MTKLPYATWTSSTRSRGGEVRGSVPIDAITDAVRQAAGHEQRDLVTRADLYRALLLQTGVLIGAGIAVLRLLG